jgi:hypothetical protein
MGKNIQKLTIYVKQATAKNEKNQIEQSLIGLAHIDGSTN